MQPQDGNKVPSTAGKQEVAGWGAGGQTLTWKTERRAELKARG